MILLSLLGQGLTIPTLLRRLGLVSRETGTRADHLKEK
jgi:NhaP-type Na+/H+ or K+/H+ antiporter